MRKENGKILIYSIKGIFFILILVCVFLGTMKVSYAIRNQAEPDVIITINKSGSISYDGNLFGEELWYPGLEKSGVVRINNNFRKMKVNDLGLDVELKKYQMSYNKDLVYDSFLNNMKLTISIGKMLVFNNTIVDNKSLDELLNKAGDNRYKGYKLMDSDQFIIGKGDSVDLKYKLSMDMDSGAELESVLADVNFLINNGEE